MLQIERLGSGTLALSGELDYASFDPFCAALDEISGPVRLDVSNLSFIDSTGLRLILDRLKRSPVVLVGMSPHFARLIEICGLTSQRGLTFEREPTG